MTITTTAAANLATSYYDAMRMVSEQSAFHLPANTSPRAALERYLQACKVCGVKLHNEHWEARAEQVVEELTARRRAAWKKAMNKCRNEGCSEEQTETGFLCHECQADVAH